MIGRYLPYIRAFLIAAALAIGPLVVAHFVLLAHAESRGREELHSAAVRYVNRAESVIGDAVRGLRRLHDGKQVDCLPETRAAFIAAVRDSAFVDSVGVVDRNGLSMCLEPTGRPAQATLLPPYMASAPVIAIGIIKDADDVAAAVIGWNVEGGLRLVARLSPEALDIEPGPENLRAHMRSVITLTDGATWREFGNTLPDGVEEWLSASVRSRKYPVEATLSAPWSAVWAPIRPLHTLVAVSAVAFGFVAILFAMRITWRMNAGSGSEFLEALFRQEFEPYFQPVVDLESGRLRGCEMLARWVKSDGTVAYPGAFMPFAESSGHIYEITRQLMRKARDQLGDLYTEQPSLKLSINLAAGHFDDRRIIEDIVDIFEGGPIEYNQLVFEVTERQPIADIERARRIIAELHSLGAKVALDDVGTGHSGLAYLQKLGVDIVKIDKMFIDALISDGNAYAIVEKLVDLADNLQMGIIAEGVETIEQIDHLRKLGVTAAQGFLFAPALPSKTFIELVGALSAHGGEDADDDADGEAVGTVAA